MKDLNSRKISTRKKVTYEICITRTGTATPLVLDLNEAEAEVLYQQLYALLGKGLDKYDPRTLPPGNPNTSIKNPWDPPYIVSDDPFSDNRSIPTHDTVKFNERDQ